MTLAYLFIFKAKKLGWKIIGGFVAFWLIIKIFNGGVGF
jgi:hypothetical protein